jgi:hypothetical protein
VALHAAKALGRAEPERIAKHRDRLLELLRYDSEWVQTEAVLTLCKIATEREHYKTVLPAIIKTSSQFTVDEASRKTLPTIKNAVAAANSDVKAFADPILKQAYVSIPTPLTDPGTGAVMSRGAKVVRSRVGAILREMPNGEEFVRRIPKTTLKSYKSGRDADMYQYSGRFEPNDELIGRWEWTIWPAANRPEEVEDKIMSWLKPRLGKGKVEPLKKDTLVIEPGGKTSKSRYYRDHFWSGNMLVGLNDDQALKMELRTYEGYDFLIIERGGKFGGGPDDEGTEAVPDDWHPGYHIYMRVE